MVLAIINFTGLALLLLLDSTVAASNRRCFPLYDYRSSLCFTQPDPPLALSWSDAQQWCSKIGATLPMDTSYIPSDENSGRPYGPLPIYNHQTVYSNAIGYFGLSRNSVWLGANSTFDLDDWYWTNGTQFTGTMERGNDTRKTHAQIIRNGTDLKIVAANRREGARSICQASHQELQCVNSWHSYWTGSKCYTKTNYEIQWNQYASGCGGINKLTTLDELTEISRWIDDQTRYWIGLSCTWWTWQDFVSGRTFELTESLFVYNFPNNTSPECLATYGGAHSNTHWVNRNCSTELQFICQEHVFPTTTARTTTTNRPTSTTTRTSTSTQIPTTTRTSTTTRIPTTTRTSTTTQIQTTTRTSTTIRTPTITKTQPIPPERIMTDHVGSSVETIGESTTSKDALTPSSTAQGWKETPVPYEGSNAIVLFVVLFFGLLAVAIWLAILTARFCKSNRYSHTAIQKRNIGDVQLSDPNPYEMPSFDDPQILKEGHLTEGKSEKSCEEIRLYM